MIILLLLGFLFKFEVEYVFLNIIAVGLNDVKMYLFKVLSLIVFLFIVIIFMFCVDIFLKFVDIEIGIVIVVFVKKLFVLFVRVGAVNLFIIFLDWFYLSGDVLFVFGIKRVILLLFGEI